MKAQGQDGSLMMDFNGGVLQLCLFLFEYGMVFLYLRLAITLEQISSEFKDLQIFEKV